MSARAAWVEAKESSCRLSLRVAGRLGTTQQARWVGSPHPPWRGSQPESRLQRSGSLGDLHLPFFFSSFLLNVNMLRSLMICIEDNRGLSRYSLLQAAEKIRTKTGWTGTQRPCTSGQLGPRSKTFSQHHGIDETSCAEEALHLRDSRAPERIEHESGPPVGRSRPGTDGADACHASDDAWRRQRLDRGAKSRDEERMIDAGGMGLAKRGRRRRSAERGLVSPDPMPKGFRVATSSCSPWRDKTRTRCSLRPGSGRPSTDSSRRRRPSRTCTCSRGHSARASRSTAASSACPTARRRWTTVPRG